MHEELTGQPDQPSADVAGAEEGAASTPARPSITADLRVGVADHFGWAIAVTASAEGDVVDRRRVELVEDGVCAAPIHYEGKNLDLDGVTALVADVRASVERATAAGFDELAGALPAPIRSISLRTLPAEFPTDIEVQLRAPWEARADAVMYRELLVEAATVRGWDVHFYEAKSVLAQAAALLGDRADDVLEGPRARLGAPWAKDHRIALAAAITAG